MGKIYGNKLYQLCEWVLRLAYLNLLWVLFTLAGLIIFGLFPSTTAAFAVARRWVNGERDTSLFRTFLSSYKMEFWKSQLLGLMILFIGTVLYLYAAFFNSQTSMFFTVMKVVTVILLFVYLMIVVFIFPIFVHFKMSFYQYLKNTIIISMVNPIPTIFSISGVLLIIFIMERFPGLMPFFCISTPVLWITFNTHQTFKKIDAKRQKFKSTAVSD